MLFPETLNAIIRDAHEKHKDDIDAALRVTLAAWRKTEERADWLDALEENAVRGLIHDRRSHINNAEKRKLGLFGGPAKVGMTEGAVLKIATETLLENLTICGVVLGDITGKQLHEFAAAEKNRAAGYMRNARFCLALQPLVPEDKTVRQCVTAKKADAIWKKVVGEETSGRAIDPLPPKGALPGRKAKPPQEELAMAGH